MFRAVRSNGRLHRMARSRTRVSRIVPQTTSDPRIRNSRGLDCPKAAGIPGLTFRQCRTTWATLYEGDAKDRQAILGHHSEQFTMAVYRKAIPARQQASVEDTDDQEDCEDGQKRGKRMNCPIRSLETKGVTPVCL